MVEFLLLWCQIWSVSSKHSNLLSQKHKTAVLSWTVVDFLKFKVIRSVTQFWLKSTSYDWSSHLCDGGNDSHMGDLFESIFAANHIYPRFQWKQLTQVCVWCWWVCFVYVCVWLLACRWNQLDLAIVLLSIMGITLEEIEVNASLPINPTIIRIMRVLRIARGMTLPPPTLTQCETPTHSKLFQGAVLWRWCKTHIPGTPLFVIFCMADLSMVRAGCEPTRWHRDTQSADKLRRSEGREKHRVRKVSLGCERAKTHCDSKWTKLQEAKERMGYSKEGWKRCKNKREINERDGIDEWLLTLK